MGSQESDMTERLTHTHTHTHIHACMWAQSCPTLCDPMNCSLPDSFGPWNFPGKNTGVSCHFLLQGNLPDSGIKSSTLESSALADGFFPTVPPGKTLELGHKEG